MGTATQSNRAMFTLPRPMAALGLLLAAALVVAVLVWPVVREDEEPSAIGTSPLGAAYRGDPARTGLMPGPGPVRAPRLRWRFAAGEVRLAAPAVAGNLVYVASSDGMVYALTAEDGGAVWQIETDDVRSTPAIAGDLVFLGGVDVSARDALTGGERWTYDPDGVATGSPVIVDGVLYVGVAGQDDDGQVQGRVVALDVANGDLIWQTPVAGYHVSAPAVADGLVVVHTSGAALVALDAEGGKLRWERQIGAYEELPGGAAIADSTIFVVGRDAVAGSDERVPVLLAIEAATGEERWRFAYEGSGLLRGPSPAVAGGTVYLGGEGVLVALDAATGQEQWRAETGGGTIDPVCANGVVYATAQVYGSVYGSTIAFDAETGSELWRVDMLDVLPTNPVVAGGLVYVAGYNFDAGDGTVYAIGGPIEFEPNASPAASPEIGIESTSSAASPPHT